MDVKLILCMDQTRLFLKLINNASFSFEKRSNMGQTSTSRQQDCQLP